LCVASRGVRGTSFELRLRSQIWRGIPWEHKLTLIEPNNLAVDDAVLLYITGDPNPSDALLGLSVANASGLRVAILNSVPNQPLFGLREDALIAYTFEQYLKTGEPDWPLLFPMVRSALSAMEAVSAFLGERGVKVRGFVVAGASKRGWTTYLTAVAAPSRVLGIIPIVFDFLNFPVQLSRQRELFGEPSAMLRDYTARGLTELFGAGAKEARLAWLVDPYSYRYAYTMPKLIVVGSNDPYWASDATGLYWPGLPDPKLLLVVPNAGHNVLDFTRVLTSVATFARAVAEGIELPKLEWNWHWEGEAAPFAFGRTKKPLERGFGRPPTLSLISDPPAGKPGIFRSSAQLGTFPLLLRRDLRGSFWNWSSQWAGESFSFPRRLGFWARFPRPKKFGGGDGT
jgi:PhoPQ-activated pathogenicity-related protein